MRWQLALSFPRIGYLIRWGATFSRMPLPSDEGELRQLCDQVASMVRDYFSPEALAASRALVNLRSFLRTGDPWYLHTAEADACFLPGVPRRDATSETPRLSGAGVPGWPALSRCDAAGDLIAAHVTGRYAAEVAA